MDASQALSNIIGSLKKYQDLNTARDWLIRCNSEIEHAEFNSVVRSLSECLASQNGLHHLADPLFEIIAEIDSSIASSNKAYFVDKVKKLSAEKKTKDREAAERERQAAIEAERLKQQRIKSEEDRKKRAREAEVRERKLAEEQKREDERKAKIEHIRKEQIENIRQVFQKNFLSADRFFKTLNSQIISIEEYEQEKAAFIQTWIENNAAVLGGGPVQAPDDEQAQAIATVNGHVQVVARAGSGKTSTLVNRAFFLLKHCQVSPSEMMLLAFNRKAALEIRRRVLGLLNNDAEPSVAREIKERARQSGQSGRIDWHQIETDSIDATAKTLKIQLPYTMTFHALAYALVHPEESLLYDGSDTEAQALRRVVQQVIDDHFRNPEFKDRIRDLMVAHFKEDWDRIVQGHYDKGREELLAYRRSLPRESMGGEYVKSYGEKILADFLFEHDVSYKYERNHWWSGINYRPDFTIFQTPESGVIVEYFGLEGDLDYDEMSQAKRNYWASKQDWTLIELSPKDFRNGGVAAFLNVLQRHLESSGIQCVILSEEEIWHRIRDRAIDRFTKSTVGFIGRCRKQSLSASQLQNLIESYVPISPVEEMFLKLLDHLYPAYLDRLKATGEEDFDGLMQRAASLVGTGQTLFERKSGSGDLDNIRFMFIDEFQDFSHLFYSLLSSMRTRNSNMELFCVGDDWQAINGFAGSDLKYFDQFENFIGISRKLYISTNYRSTKAIVSIGNALMAGRGKPAEAISCSQGNVLLSDLTNFEPSLVEKQRHSGDIITPAVLRLVSKGLADGSNVVMLCRRNRLPCFVNYQSQEDVDGRGIDRYLSLIRSYFPKGLKEKISISTTHTYKGLEKDMVIILDAVARSYPLIHPDWAFTRILGDGPKKIVDEERRLLYVALTRAIKSLVVITDGRNQSPFLEDIQRRQPLKKIDWLDFPPVSGAISRIVVKIGNQERRGGGPTFAIKDQLKASGYLWQSVGWPGWAKTFPAQTFSVDSLSSEVWAPQADGLDIRIMDDRDALIARYLVNAGEWECVVDQLAMLNYDVNET